MATINKLVKFAAKFLNMGKTKAKDQKKAVVKAKPAKTKGKPVAKKVAKPAAKKVAPKAKKVAKPVKKAKPVAAKKVAAKVAPKAKAKKEVKKAVKKVAPKAKPTAVKAKPVAAKVAPKVVAPTKPAKKEVVVIKAPAPEVKKVKKSDLKRIVKEDVRPIEKKQLYKPQPKPQPQEPAKTEKKKTMDDLNLRYSDKELKEFKDLIDNKLVSAREELKNLKEALENHTDSQAGNKAWNMEEGTDTTEMEYLMNQISRQHQYIRNLELALVRIENKTYGICRVSGKLIPKERLRIVPHATLSLEAKVARKPEEEANPSAASNAAPPSDFAEGFED
jgi:RNA polymerase-binding transcription factor DksA